MFRSKLQDTGYSIINQIMELSQSKNATDLASPIPDVSCSSVLINLIAKYMRQGKNQHICEYGLDELRKTLSQRYMEKYGYTFDYENEITITSGSTQALWSSMSAIVHEGDEVIIMEPANQNYIPSVQLNGGTPIYLPLQFPNYKINFEELMRLINQHTKMIIINNPLNSCGTILEEESLKTLQKLVSGSKIIIVSDETYSNIVYDNLPHQSLAKFPLLQKQTIIIGSLGKYLNATGWNIGYCVAPMEITKEIRRMHNYICSGSNTPFQYALVDYLKKKNEPEIMQIPIEYQRKRDLMLSLLVGSKYKYVPCSATCFQTIDYSEVSDLYDVDFCKMLIEDYGVSAIPMSVFYHDKKKSRVIRLCFARKDEVIEEGIKKLLAVQK